MNKNSGIIIPQVPLVEEKIDLNDAFNLLLQGNENIQNMAIGVLSFASQNKEMDKAMLALLASICQDVIACAPEMKDVIIKRLLFSRLISTYIAEEKYLSLPKNQRNLETLDAIRGAIDFYKGKMGERFPGLVDKTKMIHEKLKISHAKYTNDAFMDFDVLLEMIEGDL